MSVSQQVVFFRDTLSFLIGALCSAVAGDVSHLQNRKRFLAIQAVLRQQFEAPAIDPIGDQAIGCRQQQLLVTITVQVSHS